MAAIKTKDNEVPTKLPSSRSAGTNPKPVHTKLMGQTASPQAFVEASAAFRIIGDPLRLSLLLTLAEGERGVGDLCTRFGEGQPAISHNLALLRHGGFIQYRRLGNKNLYSPTAQGRRVANGLRKIVTFGQDEEPRRMKSKPIDSKILDDVSGFVDDAEAWFHSPNPEFGGRKPVELLGTAEEPRLRNRIMAAKLGMFS